MSPRGDHESDWTRSLLQTRLYRNLFLYCAGATALVILSIWLWFHSQEGGFIHDALAPTLLGTGATALVAFASLLIIAGRELQERRQLNLIQALPKAGRPQLRIGNLRVDDIRIVAVGDDLERRIRFRVNPADFSQLPRRDDPQEWALLEKHYVPELRQEAAARKQVFFDDEKLELLDAVKRRDLEDGHPITVYDLTVGATTYFRFAAMSNALDANLGEILGTSSTLRDVWDKHPLAPEHVSTLPAPAALGCGVVVVTADDQVVLLERASTFVGGPIPGDRRAAVHVVAEGMVPGDVRSPDPLLAAALRALDEELGIDVAEPGCEPLRALNLVGMFFDTRRWQPCFVWLAKLSITLDELVTSHSAARDSWESVGIFGTPFDVRADQTRALLLGAHENLVPATNHASACLALALVANDGLVLCQAAFSWGAGRPRRAAGPRSEGASSGPDGSN